jgi:fatty acid desaturase
MSQIVQGVEAAVPDHETMATGAELPDSTAGRIDGRPARTPKPVLRDAAEMWQFAAEAGFARELRALHRPRPARSLLAAAVDWLVIALAVVATSTLGWAAVAFALLAIGSRQRALGNLLHDASHWSLDRRRARSNLLANLLFCWPLAVSMAIYRDEHTRHHNFLGDPKRDPDFIHDESRLPRGSFAVWFDQIRSPQAFRSAVLGDILRMDAASRCGVALWWGCVLALITFAASPRDALIFAALWFAARATVFHAITTFREISDHVGLAPASLIGFSRNHPFDSALGHIIHPHHNGYHLLHHLTPGMPFHALPRAHAVLMRWPRYAGGEHCGSYFSGPTSAMRSWTRRFALSEPDSR